MPILIDGHNLIPKISGLALSDLDDEVDLIKLLQDYARLSQKQIEVYFDNAQPGQARGQKFGSVKVVFVRAGVPADEEIRVRLDKLGKSARNWVVVSSDNRVQTYARAVYAQVKTSEMFASELRAALRRSNQPKAPDLDHGLDETEIQMWLDIFQGRGEKRK